MGAGRLSSVAENHEGVFISTEDIQTIIAQTMVPVLTTPSTVNAAIEQAIQVFPAILRMLFMVVSLQVK